MANIREDADDFIQSPSYGPGQGNVVALIVHDAEYPERINGAYDIANLFARASFQASTTGSFDGAPRLVGSVDYGKSAWHSGAGSPWNGRLEGYEHCGYAHQTRDEWLDPYGVAMLERSAQHYAKRCHDLGIPPRFIDGDQLRQAVMSNDPSQGGIAGHFQITQGARVYGGHTDPGPHFPWDYFIDRVNAHYHGDGTGPFVPDYPVVVHPGNDGVDDIFINQTLEVQKILNEIGIPAGPEDGVYGPQTNAAVMEFQRRAKDVDGNPLVVDGIVGPKTWTALNVVLFVHRSMQAQGGGETIQDAPASEGPPWTPRVMVQGMNGADVANLQRRFVARGWNLVVDGDFGPATEQTVKAFQTEKGLAVDGAVGPETWTALWRDDNIT